MRPPLIPRRLIQARRIQPQRSQPGHDNERGVTMALVAMSMFAIIAMAGITIDIGTLYQASAEAQRSADAAALAAAKSLSLSGITGDPTNSSGDWTLACTAATAVAQTVAAQNLVGGSAPVPGNVTVTYPSSDGSTCTSPAGQFGINPMVTVQVQQNSLPAYFSRVFGRAGNTVSASATAEAFNPSNSQSIAPSGNLIPVQPRCVKPLIIPNVDPQQTKSGCTGSACKPLVSLQTGAIVYQGITVNGGGTGSVGETFSISPDCNTSGPCQTAGTISPGVSAGPVLQYLPGLAPPAGSAVGVPSCANGGGAYQEAIAGCDQTTSYQCGVQSGSSANPNQADFSENPALGASDTSIAAHCLIHDTKGQDNLLTTSYPFGIIAGAGNPLNVSGNSITNSDSIVTIPIYDSTNPLTVAGPQVPVTIVGFLQVFINSVVPGVPGALNVTVLNVVGCGNGLTTTVASTAKNGTSPVPVRLITPP